MTQPHPEAERARQWRIQNGWTQDELAELTGYSQSAIRWFEAGLGAPQTHRGKKKPGEINPYAWQRYKRVCHSVAVDRGGKGFDW